MSLLLEALKKAEKAKEEAQRRAKSGEAAEAGAQPQASAFDPESTVLDDGRHVTTRDELPDISAPLEILSDDIRAAPPKAAPLELALAEDPPAAAPPPRDPRLHPGASARAPPPARTRGADTERATAQRVFEAKFKEPNPRLPFFITIGVLSVVRARHGRLLLDATAACRRHWCNANPRALGGREAGRVAARAHACRCGAPSARRRDSGPAGSCPRRSRRGASVPPACGAAAAQPPAARMPRRRQSTGGTAAAPRAQRAARATPAAPPEDRALSVKPRRPADPSAGHCRAMPPTRRAICRRRAPITCRCCAMSRPTAMRCSASAPVEMRAQRYDQSDAYYQRVLQIDPRDPHAQAGLLALRSQQLDPVQVESRVKSMLAAQPRSKMCCISHSATSTRSRAAGPKRSKRISRPLAPTRTIRISPSILR
jgi:hypothetical protein